MILLLGSSAILMSVSICVIWLFAVSVVVIENVFTPPVNVSSSLHVPVCVVAFQLIRILDMPLASLAVHLSTIIEPVT